jgi:hypothetical protein
VRYGWPGILLALGLSLVIPGIFLGYLLDTVFDPKTDRWVPYVGMMLLLGAASLIVGGLCLAWQAVL